MAVRDTQKTKVYTWEKTKLAPRIPPANFGISLERCQQIANRAFEKYGLLPAVVKDGRARRSPCYKPSLRTICLPVPQRNTHIVLHEAAHGIARSIRKEDEGSHGPTFLRVYLDLIKWYFPDIKISELKKDAAQFNLKYAPLQDCKPPNTVLLKEKKEAYDKVRKRREELILAEKELELIEKRLKEKVN